MSALLNYHGRPVFFFYLSHFTDGEVEGQWYFATSSRSHMKFLESGIQFQAMRVHKPNHNTMLPLLKEHDEIFKMGDFQGTRA